MLMFPRANANFAIYVSEFFVHLSDRETLRAQDAFVRAKSILGEVIYLNLAVLLLERMVSFFFLSFFLAWMFADFLSHSGSLQGVIAS